MTLKTMWPVRGLGVLLAVSLTSACAGVQPSNPFDQLVRADGATIQIENHNASTVSVMLEYDGGRAQLGRVPPKATREFGVESADRVFEFRLLASIQGTAEIFGDLETESTYSSSLIALRNGETAKWSIGFPQHGAVTVNRSH